MQQLHSNYFNNSKSKTRYTNLNSPAITVGATTSSSASFATSSTIATEIQLVTLHEKFMSSCTVQNVNMINEPRKHTCRWSRRFTKRWRSARADTPISSSASTTATNNLSATMRRTQKKLAASSRHFVANSLSFSVPRRKRDRRREHPTRRRTYSAASGSSSHSNNSEYNHPIDANAVIDRSTRQQQALYALNRQLQPYNECLVARLRFLEAVPLSERSRWTEMFRRADHDGAATVAWNVSCDHYFDQYTTDTDSDLNTTSNSGNSNDDGIATLVNAFSNRCTIEPSITAMSMERSITPLPLLSSHSYRHMYTTTTNTTTTSLSDHEYDGDGDEEEDVEICLNGPNYY
ncbi:hypothetical protein BDF22DRAFT_704293 [Syncephalis plumigaleata]|nr:hypothetical protein BDF22DRAFT_704293 [Syncephalis plumigaleata]